MRRTLSILVLLAIAGFVCQPAGAQLRNTLYEQEGLAADGYIAIDASGQGPATDPNRSNWKYQYGSYTWSGVYSWDTSAWVEEQEGGTSDSKLDIESDIEMYCAETLEQHKIYFHIGNIYDALENPSTDLTACVAGTLTSNNGQYVGISFDGTSKATDPASYFEGYPDTLTGRIFNAMVGTVDCGGRDISSEAFDITITLKYSGTGGDTGGAYVAPDTYGEGAHGTIPNALWWGIAGGAPGQYTLEWKIELHPDTHQVDGNYHLDPALVVAPVM
jgi:hypothetical protein